MRFFTQPTLSDDASVDPENFRIFLVVNYVAHLGFAVHLVFVPLFFFLHIHVLAAFNVVSSVVWFASLRLNQKGNHGLAVTLLSCELVLHTALAVYLVGWSAGFQNYLLAAIPIAVFNQQWRTRTTLVVTGGRSSCTACSTLSRRAPCRCRSKAGPWREFPISTRR